VSCRRPVLRPTAFSEAGRLAVDDENGEGGIRTLDRA
jgi:hypothetical protein